MSHTYQSTYPPHTKVDSGIVQFFEDFYKLSDTPDAHDAYVGQFTKDATLIMASKKGVGSDGTYFLLLPCSVPCTHARSQSSTKCLFCSSKRRAVTDERTEILNIRKGLWTAISERLHSPIKIFPFGDGEGVNEVMLYGTVAFKFKDGRRDEVRLSYFTLMPVLNKAVGSREEQGREITWS